MRPQIAGAWLVMALGSVLPVVAVECMTPPSWMPRVTDSTLDLDGNGIDDRFDSVLPGTSVTVLVNLNRCIEGAELARLQTYGVLALNSRFLSLAILRDVPVERLPDLVKEPFVAFAEFDGELESTLEYGVRVIRARKSTDYSPATIEDQDPPLRGNGVTIAIVDTGVDDGLHESLPAWKFAGGTHCLDNFILSCIDGNPDDDHGHGTHVAGIALGVGDRAGNWRGVAPNARLVDVKVLNRRSDGRALGSTGNIVAGLNRLLDRQREWGVDLVNLSLGGCDKDDGKSATSQMVNRLVDAGMTVIVAAGNCGNCQLGPMCVNISDPAGAEKAITVANLADMSTVARGDDAINAGSCRGPRQSDGDGVTDDEEKPDLAAPGTAIRAPEFDTTSGYTDKTGTSMAAPHVAGCAALLLEKDPLITPTAMKSLLRRTASPGGGVPGWDPAWGEGSLDCFRAWQETVDRKTNLTFLGSCSSLPSPPIPPCWDHPAIKTFNPVIYANLPNTINARIVNAGPAPSGPFEVRLGVWYFGNGTGEEFVCSRQVANLDPGAAPLVVECPWTPKAAALPFPVLPVPIYIASLRATIVYANDTNPLDNKASRFRSYGATKSPFEATGLVVNSTFDDLTMNLSPTPACATATGACPGWSFSSSSTGFPLAAGDCPEPVRFTLEPVAPDASREATIHVAVSGFNPATGENVPQEGLTMSASLGCLARGLDFPLAPANRDRLRWAGESFFLECPRTFDLARGDLPIVPYPATNTGDFTGATCLADEIAAPEWDDPLVPAAGGGFWYAARAGGPIPGSWDEPAGSGMEGTRDATLASCP